MEKLGDRLRSLREKSDKTQKEMATLLCISRVGYTQYENNKRTPPPDTLKKIAGIFNVSVDYLLGSSSENNDSDSSQKRLKNKHGIVRNLENMIESLDGAAAMGEIEDEEDRELLRTSLETAMKIAKRASKRKDEPKDYQK